VSDYLEDAAAELRKARDANERRAELIPSLAAGSMPTGEVAREVNDRRMEIAAAFTRLAECQAAMLDAARMPDFLGVSRGLALKGQDPEDSP
jgi:hypothetical protein